MAIAPSAGNNLRVTNSIISHNTAAIRDGGIYMGRSGDASLEVAYSSVVYNAAYGNDQIGGGIHNRSDGECTVVNTILRNLSDGELSDLGAAYSDQECVVSHTLITGAANSDYVDTGDNITGVQPELMALTENGGIGGRTHQPGLGSPVIGAGQNLGNAPEWDLRGSGFPRILGEGLDMGAHEVRNAVFHDRFEVV